MIAGWHHGPPASPLRRCCTPPPPPALTALSLHGSPCSLTLTSILSRLTLAHVASRRSEDRNRGTASWTGVHSLLASLGHRYGTQYELRARGHPQSHSGILILVAPSTLAPSGECRADRRLSGLTMPLEVTAGIDNETPCKGEQPREDRRERSPCTDR
jgi:hypothetical protein